MKTYKINLELKESELLELFAFSASSVLSFEKDNKTPMVSMLKKIYKACSEKASDETKQYISKLLKSVLEAKDITLFSDWLVSEGMNNIIELASDIIEPMLTDQEKEKYITKK